MKPGIYLRPVGTDELFWIGEEDEPDAQAVAGLYQASPVVTAELIVQTHRAIEHAKATPYGVVPADELCRWLGEQIERQVSHESP